LVLTKASTEILSMLPDEIIPAPAHITCIIGNFEEVYLQILKLVLISKKLIRSLRTITFLVSEYMKSEKM
jgi:hypothetical protein